MIQLRLCLHLLFALFAVFLASQNSLATQTEAVHTKSALLADSSSATTTIRESVSRSGEEIGLNAECRGSAKAYHAPLNGIPKLSFGIFVEFLAAETTALSPYRVTTAGETFYHYGYAEQAAGFQGGLRPGGFATSSGNLTGQEALSGLALRRPTAPPNAVYTVTPTPGTPIRVNPVASPNFGQPGGLPEYQFPGGTFPGTVSGPTPILPR